MYAETAKIKRYLNIMKMNKLWFFTAFLAFIIGIWSLHVYTNYDFVRPADLRQIEGTINRIEASDDDFYIELDDAETVFFLGAGVYRDYDEIDSLKTGMNISMKVDFDSEEYGRIYQLVAAGYEMVSLDDSLKYDKNNKKYSLICGIMFCGAAGTMIILGFMYGEYYINVPEKRRKRIR